MKERRSIRIVKMPYRIYAAQTWDGGFKTAHRAGGLGVLSQRYVRGDLYDKLRDEIKRLKSLLAERG